MEGNMAWLVRDGSQSLLLGIDSEPRQCSASSWFGGGPKGPPSAPPTIPPIIINPFKYQTPDPAIDPRITPIGPPVLPPRRPAMSLH